MGECGAVKKLSPNASFCAEESNTERPLLMISRPPDIRINPYTNKPMPTQQAKLNSSSHPLMLQDTSWAT